MLGDELKRENHGRFFVWLKNLFKDEIVHTVAGFKYHHGKKLNTHNKQSVVVVHDAQKLSLNDIDNLKSITDGNQGKLILLNNTDSTHGFSAGNPIKTLKDNGVNSTVALSARKHIEVEIAVSKNADTHAVLEQATHIIEGDKSTLVALTNSQKTQLTTQLRKTLKSHGHLSNVEKQALVLSTNGLTDAQKKHVKYYSSGDRITFKAFTKEQKHYEVINVCESTLTLKNEQGKISTFKPEQVEKYQVSKVEKMAFSNGDLIKADRALFVNRQKYDKDTIFKVADISADKIKLKDEFDRIVHLDNETLSKSYLSYSYVKKPNQLQKNDTNLIFSAKPYQLNRNLIGELSEKATHMRLYTPNKTKAQNFFDKEQIKWSAHDIAQKQPDLIYRNVAYANPIIEKDITALVQALDLDQKNLNKQEVAKLAVSFAVAKCAEKQAAFKHSELMSHALAYALGSVEFKDIAPVLKERMKEGNLVHMQTYWTTRASIELEKDILTLNYSEQNTLSPIENDKNKLLNLPITLTRGQKEAITLVCTSTDRFNSIQGLAGVGKTTMMREVLKVAQQNGYKVLGLAPTHQAKDELISNGIASETIDAFLTNATPVDDKTIIIADESSMIDNLSYHKLQKAIKAADSRLFYAGDITQLQSLSSGIPHELTIKTKSQKTVYMDEIVRQNPNPVLKKAAQFSSNREIRKAFDELDKISPDDWVERRQTVTEKYAQSVVEIRSDESVSKADNNPIYEAIANDYLSRSKGCRDNTIVLVPAHKDRAHIDARVREGLKKESEISSIDYDYTRLLAKSRDSADFTKIQTFEKGDVLRFGRSYHIGKKGDYFKIQSVDYEKNKIHLSGEDKEKFCINPSVLIKAKASIYEERATQLAKGDRIRLKLSDENTGFVANKEYSVASVNEEFALIENGGNTLKLFSKDKATQHWDYAYTNTAYALQGATAKYGIGLELKNNVVVTTHRSHEIINTRPSHQLTIYTDDREGLLERLENPVNQRDADKKSALMELDKDGAAKSKQQRITQQLSERANNTHALQKAKITPKTGSLDKQANLDKDELLSALNTHSQELVTHLLGEPNAKLSNQNNYRYGEKGSLSVNLSKGLWYNFETGDKGNLFHLIETEKGLSSFRDVLKFAAEFTKNAPDMTPIVKTKVEKDAGAAGSKMQKLATKYYQQSKPIKGSLAEKYLLVHRGLSQIESADIRYCPSIYTKTDNKVEYLPGLLAFSRNDKGQINHVQVTRLDKNSANKNKQCDLVKQTFSSINGHAINLNNKGEGDKIYLTEGVETGLSIVESNPWARVFTLLGKENFGNVRLDNIPTKTVVLCVDNDGQATFKYKKNGTNNIIQAANRLEDKGLDVLICLPKKNNQDLNDILRLDGTSGIKKELENLIKPNDFKSLCNKENIVEIVKSDVDNKSYSYNNTTKDISKNYDISQSQLINGLKIEAAKIKSSMDYEINSGTNKPINKNREVEREL